MKTLIAAALGLAAVAGPAHAEMSMLGQYLLLQQMQEQQPAPYEPAPTWNCNHYQNSSLCQQTSPSVYPTPTVTCNHYQNRTVCQ